MARKEGAYMDIGISTAIFYPDVLTENAVELLAAQGFRTGEVFANSFFEFTPEYALELRERADRVNFRITSVHTVSSAFEPYLFDAYPRRREDFFRIYQSFVRFAEILGAKAYTFHGLVKRPHRNMSFQDVVYIYDRMIYEGLEHGVALAQENVSWCLSGDLEYLKRLKEAVKEPLKFTLDIKQAVKAGRRPEEYLELYGKDLVNLHLNDHDASAPCLLPGKGTYDFRGLREKLAAVGYEGPGIIEVYKENYTALEDLAASRVYLERILG